MFFVPTHDRLVQGPMIKGNEKILYKQGGKCEKAVANCFIRHLKHGVGGCIFLMFSQHVQVSHAVTFNVTTLSYHFKSMIY